MERTDTVRDAMKRLVKYDIIEIGLAKSLLDSLDDMDTETRIAVEQLILACDKQQRTLFGNKTTIENLLNSRESFLNR